VVRKLESAKPRNELLKGVKFDVEENFRVVVKFFYGIVGV